MSRSLEEHEVDHHGSRDEEDLVLPGHVGSERNVKHGVLTDPVSAACAHTRSDDVRKRGRLLAAPKSELNSLTWLIRSSADETELATVSFNFESNCIVRIVDPEVRVEARPLVDDLADVGGLAALGDVYGHGRSATAEDWTCAISVQVHQRSALGEVLSVSDGFDVSLERLHCWMAAVSCEVVGVLHERQQRLLIWLVSFTEEIVDRELEVAHDTADGREDVELLSDGDSFLEHVHGVG